MKTDLKPTDPEYIEALADKYCPKLDTGHILSDEASKASNAFLKVGYQLAIEHTNHSELVVVVKELMNVIIDDNKFIERNFQKIANVNDLLTKSETSKL